MDYQAFFNQSPALMVVLDPKFNIISVSNKFLETSKTTREKVIGQYLFDVFPDNPDEINFEGGKKIRASLNSVLINKVPDTLSVLKYDIPNLEGGFIEKYWKICHSPVFDDFNEVENIIQVAEDVSENETLINQLKQEEKALKLIKDSEKRYNMLLMKSPFGFANFKGKDMVITLANNSIKDFWGKGNDVEGKALFDLLPELRESHFPKLLLDVYTTGKPFYGDELLAPIIRNGKLEDVYFNFIYQPYLDIDETIIGVTIIAYEVTPQALLKKALAEQHQAEQKTLKRIAESNERYYTMLMKSSFAFSIMTGKDMVVTLANDLMKSFWGKGENVEGKTLLQVLPELANQPFPQLMNQVYETGIPYYTNEILAQLVNNDKIEDRYFNVAYQPVYEQDNSISGVSTIAYEVTEQVNNRKKIEESELHFRQLANLMPAKISNADKDGKVTYFNKHWIDYTGLSFEDLKDYGFHKIIHPDELKIFKIKFQNASISKTIIDMEMRILDKNGEYKWHIKLASPVLGEKSEVKMWVISTTEIHEQIKQKAILKKAVRERTKELEKANKLLQFQNDEKEKRAQELNIANKELAYQNDEKENRAQELNVANKELAYQNDEKEKRAQELNFANKELAYQNDEKEKRSVDLVNLSRDLKIQQHELKRANELLIKQDKSVSIINKELSLLNQELEKRVINRTKALAESEIRFRSMMETIPQISWTNTVDGEFTFYNQRWYDYTGLNKKETKELGPKSIIHADDLPAARNEYFSILKNGKGGEFQIRGKREDGLYRWHLIRLMPIKNEGEKVAQLWVGTATDIQELRLLQQQKDDFISIASHELKTPITALKASLQIMNKMKENPSSVLFTNLIGRANISLDKVSSLVENLLNTSKANEDQIHLNLKIFTISKIAEDCCHHIKDEGCYTIKTEGDLELKVQADAMRIDQVIINLVNNAVKYAPKSKEVVIKIEKLAYSAKVSITDNGPGIDPEKLPHLFDRYYRVDSSGNQYSGLGLGLYISAEIIKKHKGEIGVDSELGKGSTFWFTLPL